MASYADLQAQISKLQAQANAARAEEITAVVADIRAKMVEYGLTVADLNGGRSGTRRGATVAPKYRNPETGETWTGRGKPPRWMAAQVAAGKTKEDFLIA